MSDIDAALGSSIWIDQVFKTPPVRRIKSRSKRTHRHLVWLFALGRLGYVESRNELIAALLLEYLTNIGIVTSFKEQPFTTSPELWNGLDENSVPTKGRNGYTPDFIALTKSSEKFVIEVKAARFITRENERDFVLWKDRFAQSGLTFVVWTDQTGLTSPLRSNLLRMRRAAVIGIEPDEQYRLLDLLKSKGSLPLWALYQNDFDIDLIAMAVWQGKAHFTLNSVLSEQSVVSLEPIDDLAESLFGISPDLHHWWNALDTV